MSCNIQYTTNGEVKSVNADNGNTSLLYKEATKKFGKEQGLEIYLASKSDYFQDNILLSQSELDENNEPKLKTVLNYLSLQNESKEPLTTQQKLDLKNIALGVENFSVQKLVDAFYSDGIFNVSPKKLKKSGLYSDYEIANLANDIDLQQTVKQSLEAIKNTEGIEIEEEFVENLEKTAEINSFGKLTNINPNLVQKEVLNKLAGTTEEEFEANLAELEYPSFQKSLDKPKKIFVPKKTEELKFQIIGEKGAQNLDQIEEATFRMDNLKVAREMEAAGKTPKEIRLATGWEKGVDGLFRYEIQDGTFNDVPLNFNVSVPFMEEPTAKVSLPEVYNNEELFKAYPKLKNTDIYVYETENPLYDENKMFVYKGNIYINSRTYDTRNNTLRLSVEEGTEIAHEASHIIQQTEGFATGSSITWNRERVRESIDAIKTKIRTGVRREGFSGRYDSYIENLLRKSIGEDLIEPVVFAKDIEVLVDALARKAYINFAGEVEARNVQARFLMSPQQRLEQTLQETQDTPFEDQLVAQFIGGIMSTAKTAPQITQEIIDKLKQNGLSEDVFLLSTEEINAKLIELGVSEDVRRQVDAWHGSPYSLKKFLLEKIGTGEGAQAFGWGLYFTDLESIAKSYATSLAQAKSTRRYKYEKSLEDAINNKESVAYYTDYNSGYKIIYNSETYSIGFDDRFRETRLYRGLEELTKEQVLKELMSIIKKDNKKGELQIKGDLINLRKEETISPERNLYKVSLHKGKTPSEYTWLEWDKKISEINQKKINSQFEKEGLPKTVSSSANETMRLLGKETDYKTYLPNPISGNGENFYEDLVRYFLDSNIKNPQKQASLFLLEAGIDGIKYPAESISRGATSDNARGFNYVVFDENAITIEEQIQFSKSLNNIGINLITNGLTYKDNKTGKDIVILNKDTADDSTLLHEFNHIFLNWAKTERPEIYKKGLDLVKAEIGRDSSEIADIISYVKTTQPNLTGNAFLEEILTELTGRKGAELINSKKNSGIIDWIKEFFAEIGQMLGILDATPQEIANMTIGEFAQKSAVQLLKGERIRKEAQEYFTRNADRLPLTLSVFSRPEFVKLQGKEVNPITVLNSLNQSGIKQIEKDLIKQVVEQNYQGQKKISYDELEATVRANIMPLERIFTSSYANYGMDNLGNGNYGEANTIILNAPIEHGVTGHFSGDFKASGRKNIKYQPKQLNDNVWVAVEEGYESQANNNNIYQYVGTAGTKEAVDTWIENYEKPTTDTYSINDKDLTFEIDRINYGGDVSEDLWTTQITLLENGKVIKKQTGFDYNISEADAKRQIVDLANGDIRRANKDINKGMFGHIRVWQEGEVFTVAELQSDTYQKNNAKNLIEPFAPEYVVEKVKLQKKYQDLTKGYFKKIGITILVDNPFLLNLSTPLQIRRAVEAKTILLDKDSEIQKLLDAIDEGFKSDNIEARRQLDKDVSRVVEIVKTNTNIEFNKDYIKELNDLKNKYLTPQEKQFIASQKIWEQRMVREAIKEASLSGATSLRFPTPYTLSVIEGYVSKKEGDKPYTIISTQNEQELGVGDIIRYEGMDYFVESSDSEEVKVSKATTYSYRKKITYSSKEFLEEFNVKKLVAYKSEVLPLPNKKFESYEYNSKVFGRDITLFAVKDEKGNIIQENLSKKSDAERIAKNKEYLSNTNITRYIYNKQLDQVYVYDSDTSFERFGQPYTYKESNKNNFNISDLSDTQQTVARKYEEIAEILKKEKPVEIVTDENGFDWYEAKIEQQDTQKPVVAFQKKSEPIKEEEQPTAPQQNYKEQLFQEMQGYKKAEVFMEVDGEIVQAKNTNTAVILPLVAKQIDNIEDINKLQQYDLEILQANQEDTVEILKGIQTDLIAQGIDVAGLADKEINAELMSFLGELEVFINNPTVENTKAFADVYDAYFEKDLSPKTEIIKAQETDRDFVKLNTNLSEEQVYEQQGLIKVKDGLYIRTNKQDLNTLYSSLETYTEKYPKDTNLKEYVQTQIATSDFKNSDNSEAVYLYKMYFNIATTNEKEAVKNSANFTGNYEYLTTEFVSDFYIEMLKEREKNSEIYKNFYSNFDINENGIYLKNEDNITMSQVKEYSDENLKQYSIISKQMPLLTEQEIQSETKQVRRDAILNSPQNLEKYQGQYHKLNDNNLILKNSGEEFIKVGGNIFEAVDTDGNLTLYSRLNSMVGEYYTFENEAPKTNVKIEDYSYLNTQPEKFLNEKSYLSKSAKEKINRENFDCI